MEQHLIVLVSPGKTDGRGKTITNVIHLVDGNPVFKKGVTLVHDTSFEHDYRTVYGCGLGEDGEFVVTSSEKLFTSLKDRSILNCVSNKRATQIGKLHRINSTTQMRGLFLYVRAGAVMLTSMAKHLNVGMIESGNALDQAIELHSTSDCCEDMSFLGVIESPYMGMVWLQAISTIKTFNSYG